MEPQKKKARKSFDKAELAALDTVYKVSNRNPDLSMVERLAISLAMEKDQVGNILECGHLNSGCITN